VTGRVVVFGGTGFIGSHICRVFEEAGWVAVSVSRHPAPRLPRTAGAPAESVWLDLAETGTAQLAVLLSQAHPDVVVNAAAGVWRASERKMTALNADFVGRLVAALATAPTGARLVHLGSAHEYGESLPGVATTEDQPAAPVSVYGRTKLLGTMAVLRAASDSGLAADVLRIANVVGPGIHPDSLPGRVAHRLARMALAARADDGPLQLRLAPLRAWRDYVDVLDVARAVLAAATAPAAATPAATGPAATAPAGPCGRVINIARGEAVPVRRLVDQLIDLSGLPVQIVEEPGGASTLREDMDWQLMDVSRARRLLRWRPERGLDESLRDLLADVWPREHGGVPR
jgi:NDP-hexose 4-ketoreductase